MTRRMKLNVNFPELHQALLKYLKTFSLVEVIIIGFD